MPGKKAVLFNLWGVVLDSRPDDIFYKFEETHKLPRGFLSQITSRESSAMTKAERGELSLVQMIPQFEAECRAAAQAQGVCLPGNFSVTVLLDQFRETKPLHLSVLRTATVLHQHGLATAVLANQWVDDSASGDSGSRLLALLGGHFDLVLQSCRSGHRVPESAMFNSSLQHLNVTPQQSVWLDVNEEGVNAAKAAGMAAILVTDVAEALDKLSNFTGVEAVTENTVPPICADELSHGYVTIKPGVRTHYVEVGTGPPVVLCHGFPESWYSWRYQIQAIAEAGFRVLALDMKGYGESSAPTEIEEYSQQQITQDLITFMDKMALPQVTLVGHDWGGCIVWDMAQFDPERVRAVASLNTPLFPVDCSVPPMEQLGTIPILDYYFYFQTPGVAEAELERDLERTFKSFFVSSADGTSLPDTSGVRARGGLLVGLPDEVPRSSMLSEEALQYYVSQFKRNGFRGPLNWYRNIERNWRWKCSRPVGKLMMPALMVTAGKDPLLVPILSRGMEERVPNLTRGHIEQNVVAREQDHYRLSSAVSREMTSKRYSMLSAEPREMEGRGLLDAMPQPVVKLCRIDPYSKRFTVSKEMTSKSHSTLSEEPREMDQGRGLLAAMLQPVVKLCRIDPYSKRFTVSKPHSTLLEAQREMDHRRGLLEPVVKLSRTDVCSAQLPVKKHTYCDQCGKNFFTRARLKVHQRTHTGEKPFHCDQCGIGCVTSGDLKLHQRVHTGEKPYHCDQCGKRFTRSYHARKHLIIHTGEKPFTCDQCGKSYKQYDYLKSHQRSIHSGEKPYHCDQCGKRFVKNSYLKNHQRSHAGYKPYFCDQCGKGFTSLNSLNQHELTIHTGMKSFDCDQCGKCFSLYSYLVSHQRIHSGEKPYHCGQCGKSFSQSCSLREHLRIHTGERPYPCQQCEMSFKKLEHLKNHQRIHTGEKPFQCKECGASFRQISSLKKHQMIHTGEKPFHCESCGKSFRESKTLKQHKRTHTGEKPYECDQCGERFSLPQTLKGHYRIHTGEKPFNCEQCGKSFSRRDTLQNHQLTHTGVKSFYCTHCGKSFANVSYLITHERIHTGEKPFKCELCGKSFSQCNSLKSHRNIHTGNKFYCTQCGKGFAHLESFKVHTRIHTGEKPYECKQCKKSFRHTNTLKSHRCK